MRLDLRLLENAQTHRDRSCSALVLRDCEDEVCLCKSAVGSKQGCACARGGRGMPCYGTGGDTFMVECMSCCALHGSFVPAFVPTFVRASEYPFRKRVSSQRWFRKADAKG